MAAKGLDSHSTATDTATGQRAGLAAGVLPLEYCRGASDVPWASLRVDGRRGSWSRYSLGTQGRLHVPSPGLAAVSRTVGRWAARPITAVGVQASPRGVAPCCIIVRVQLVHHDWQDVGVQGSSPAGMKVIESVMPMLMPMPTRPVSPTLAGPRGGSTGQD